MNDEYVNSDFTKEELAAISAEMRSRITADDIVEIINGFDGPTIPAEQMFAELEKQFPGHFQWNAESIRG
jgi:hypothetical protein